MAIDQRIRALRILKLCCYLWLLSFCVGVVGLLLLLFSVGGGSCFFVIVVCVCVCVCVCV